jgi:hypothetical protein
VQQVVDNLLITESTPKLLDKIVDSLLTIERGEVS